MQNQPEQQEEVRPLPTKQALSNDVKSEILKSISNISDASKAVAKIATERKYFGKTLDEWDTCFSVTINTDCNSAQLINYCSQLNSNLNTIYSYLNKSKKMYSDYKLSYGPAFSEGLRKELSAYTTKRPPALDSLKAITETKLKDRTLMTIEFESLIEFWQDMLYKVRNQIDLIKIVGMANGTRARIESGL